MIVDKFEEAIKMMELSLKELQYTTPFFSIEDVLEVVRSMACDEAKSQSFINSLEDELVKVRQEMVDKTERLELCINCNEPMTPLYEKLGADMGDTTDELVGFKCKICGLVNLNPKVC